MKTITARKVIKVLRDHYPPPLARLAVIALKDKGGSVTLSLYAKKKKMLYGVTVLGGQK